ncbi:MAG TPA: hypothetical protein VN704_08440, partial [Verrucomicrobiae bacterium]|nr:hypothetical protein [Verrucomicrobiae bacterium]
SKERNMFVVKRFLSKAINMYGKHQVLSDGGTWYSPTYRFLKLNHHLSFYDRILLKEHLYMLNLLRN